MSMFRHSAEDLAFCDDVRAFIAENLPAETRRQHRLSPGVFCEPDISRRWLRALHGRGWAAPGWPVEYGGTGWTPVQRYIFETECADNHVPASSSQGVPVLPFFLDSRACTIYGGAAEIQRDILAKMVMAQ